MPNPSLFYWGPCIPLLFYRFKGHVPIVENPAPGPRSVGQAASESIPLALDASVPLGPTLLKQLAPCRNRLL